jgi:penicillin-binding protein 2
MLAGFAGVTTDPGGTATTAFAGFPTTMPVAGKTGTAQVGPDPATGQPRQDTSLFAAFAPADAPRDTGVTVIESGGFGSDAAAPVIRHIFEPVATGSLPAVPAGGRFDPAAVLRAQPSPVPGGPND